jgi:uncharacterized protein YraI
VSIRSSGIVLIVLVFLSTGCIFNRREETITAPTPLIIPSTLPATQTLAPSETMTPLPAQPTAPRAIPIEGLTATQINVRAEPSTVSNVLGIIPANTKVEITGKDPGENWWQINYAQGIDGKGWVTAQYITTTTKPEVPIIGGAVQADPKNGNVAIVQQQINVRSGPGTDFNSLGTLNPQDIVGLIGKDANGVWLQIDFASGPEGKGWVNAAFVQAQGVENLPIITETGLIVGTGTPTGIPLTPIPTMIPAWEDHDSPSNPVASVDFASTGIQTLIYNGDLSSPQGDTEDWIVFEPDGPFVFASLDCKGGDSLKIEITDNDLPIGLELACGDQMKQIPVRAGDNYLIHLRAPSSTGSLQYINYTLTIKTRPL